MKRASEYALDLTKIDGKGEFACPRCGNIISPEDESEENYSILEPRVNCRGLYEVEIRCNKCSCTIYLTGFSLLQKLSKPSVETNIEAGDQVYVAHV